MVNAFRRKLAHAACLSAQEERIVEALSQPELRLGPKQDVVHEGDETHFVTLLLEGWACRYRMLENGHRQIIGLLLPGDLSEPYGILPRFSDHSFKALTPIRFVRLAPAALRRVARDNPGIEQALWWDMLVASAIQREHTVSLGKRSAIQRLGHLFCELHLRLGAVDQIDDGSFEMPVTQVELGDMLGLTSVHINRSLKELKDAGLIGLRSRRMVIRDVAALRAASLFDPAYLHLDRIERH